MKHPFQVQHHSRCLSKISAFTLTDLLLAAAITGVTIVISGLGLSSIISSSMAVTERAERQDELNRALDFIAAEIRESDEINRNIDISTFLDSDAVVFQNALAIAPIKPASVNEILGLKITRDDPAGTKMGKVVYFVGEPNSDDILRGPQVVYRWGPKFEPDGQYVATLESTANYQIMPLMDSLHNDISDAAAGLVVPDCGAWTPAIDDPAIAKDLGFYACISPNKKAASLLKVGQVNKVLAQPEPMSESRQVYARASDSSIPASLGVGGGCISGCGGGGPKPLLQKSKLTFELMGGEIACNGTPVDTEVEAILTKPDKSQERITLNKNEPITRIVPKDTVVHFIAQRDPNNPCGPFKVNSSHDTGTQVISLDNGQSIPFYTPYKGQQKIEDFLTNNYLDGNLVKIKDNQKVFLFELGDSYQDTPGPGYDLQDAVVLAEVEPL